MNNDGNFFIVYKRLLINMIKESSEYYKPMDDQEESYKQELGLKKMLYKYEHENEQLKSQIKALT